MPGWTLWLIGFVAFAAAVARLVHFWDAGRSLAAPSRAKSREASLRHATENVRQRFREGADPTWEDDLNDALRTPTLDDGPEMVLPGVESLRGDG